MEAVRNFRTASPLFIGEYLVFLPNILPMEGGGGIERVKIWDRKEKEDFAVISYIEDLPEPARQRRDEELYWEIVKILKE